MGGDLCGFGLGRASRVGDFRWGNKGVVGRNRWESNCTGALADKINKYTRAKDLG